VVWGVLLLGEEITWLRVAAMLVIFLGIAFATTRGGVVRFATR
jgi:drug/metabolite transporter (DMT)-like permease